VSELVSKCEMKNVELNKGNLEFPLFLLLGSPLGLPGQTFRR
jgi:hypothetical protein